MVAARHAASSASRRPRVVMAVYPGEAAAATREPLAPTACAGERSGNRTLVVGGIYAGSKHLRRGWRISERSHGNQLKLV